MRIFEEELSGSIFTLDAPQVLRIEARVDIVQGELDRRPRRKEYAVVIYQCKTGELPAPRQVGDSWVMPDNAIETRFVQVTAESDGGCFIPEQAGRLLGHYVRDGRRWWVFLEKLGSASTPESPGTGGPQKSASGSPPGSKAPAAASSPKAQPSKPQAAPRDMRPGNTPKPEVR